MKTLLTLSALAIGLLPMQLAHAGKIYTCTANGRVTYTTKPSGKGLGLGLSLSHAIVHEMGGSIRADNAHPGACFTLSLPRAPEPNADPPPPP